MGTDAYTAAQIGKALDRAPRSVRRSLEGIAHSTVVVAAGIQTKAWAFDALPEAMRCELAARARQQGYRDVATMFSSPPAEPWRPRIPLADVAPQWLDKAVRLQRALMPSLERYEAGDSAGAELEARGREDYKREFGTEIAVRTWRYLFQRTRDRSRTADDFRRVEIYLDDNAARRKTVRPTNEPRLDALSGMINRIPPEARDKPSLDQREMTFREACEVLQDAGGDRPVKVAIVDLLWKRMPGLADSREGLRKSFARWYQNFLQGTDGDLRRRNYRPEPVVSEEKQEAIDVIAARAGTHYRGRMAPAHRDAVEAGLLPQSQSESKSYVANSIRRQARRKAKIAFAATLRKGLRSLIPDIERDPSTCFANDIFTGDDFTFPILTWWPDNNERGFTYGPGQTLLMADFRCWFVTAFSLQPDPQYNSHVVRTLLTRSAMEHGLPRILYFERGQIWQHAKILKGDDAVWQEAATGDEFIHGLKTQLGIRFIHAKGPQGKSPIESIGRITQEYLTGEPGYTGRDQRVDLPERTRNEIRKVESGVHPSEFWYHIDDWRKRLRGIIERYNSTKQQGLYLHNMSPSEAMLKFQRLDDPPIKLDAHSWPQLACQKARRRVHEDGVIKFQVGGETYRYVSEDTALKLGGEMVILYWNPETPEFIGVTDEKGRNPMIVPRMSRAHVFDTDDPHTGEALKTQSRCHAALKAQYETLKAIEGRHFRQTVVSRDVSSLARQMADSGEEMVREKKAAVSRTRRAQRLAEELSVSTARLRHPTEAQLEALRGMQEAKKMAAETPEQ